MLNIGCHLSVSGGYKNMGETALSIGANTFQFFSRNPRGGAAKAIDPQDAENLITLMKENSFAPLLAHAPYTLNPASNDERIRAFALDAMSGDLQRMEMLPGNMYNFHPGSHVGLGEDKGISLIIDVLNTVLFEDMTTTVLLETMAGKGSEIGRSFEQLKRIIDGTKLNGKLGVCIDTCHIYDAGYDIVNNLDGVLHEFDDVVGLTRLKAVHLNDSKNIFESHKDRHEKIGEGSLGLETFKKIINHPALRGLPFYLETPNETDGYKEEIALLKSLYEVN
ncbi:MAG: deoxyribonuclease IV [Oscillospiraceae bacterium]|jgi:deoxyribonuclease-4|nr:deoxyribonuclease IV [Oscillospiraceae bacterium]